LLISCGSKEQAPTPEEDSNQSETDSQTPERNISLDMVMGKFEPSEHADFTKVDSKYADRADMYLHRETYDAFMRMFDAAKTDGINLVIRSATRNFYRQKEIWEGKWTGARLVENNENLAQTTPDPQERALKILEWSSMPGSSRHHWGTDIDLNAFNNDYFKSGEGAKVYTWLQAHAHEYGFCQPYSEKGSARPFGYNEERWHWSYTPLASLYILSAVDNLFNENITGFLGSETAVAIDVKRKYILGIDLKCLD
jgi:LAS superfamily LD-carboxypeptidase LdcB